MVYQLFTTFKSSSAIAIILLLTNKVYCSATEYVFTAPPEVGQEVLEIPASETEYPLYECEAETETKSEPALDSHECSCIDCGEVTQDAEADAQLTSKNKPTRQ
ncbi:MAG: hypothetical protein AAGF83_23300 [Cyanobacteria bacterium P01_G01_bin.67]